MGDQRRHRGIGGLEGHAEPPACPTGGDDGPVHQQIDQAARIRIRTQRDQAPQPVFAAPCDIEREAVRALGGQGDGVEIGLEAGSRPAVRDRRHHDRDESLAGGEQPRQQAGQDRAAEFERRELRETGP